MSLMSVDRALRLVAVAIAALGLLDPSITLNGRSRARLSVVQQGSPSMELPAVASGSTRRSEAAQVVARLHDDLSSDFDVVDGRLDDAAVTVVVGDRYPEDDFAEQARVSTVTVSSTLRPNVRLADVDAPSAITPGTVLPLAAVLEATGMAGSRSDVVVRAGGAEVGRASHDWTDDSQKWTAEIAAVPIGQAPYEFDVSVTSTAPELTDLDNHAHIVVDRAEPLRVFVLEARPSWASAFVRRAIEADPRFELRGVSDPSPRVAVTTGDPAPPASRIDRIDGFDVVIAGGLDKLSAADVAALDHFMSVRGGGVVLLPDSRLAANAVSRIFPAVTLTERLLETPAALQSPVTASRLDASELLEAESVPGDARVLASNPGSGRAIVWTATRGEGRVLMSGAMDAWRFRGQPGSAFDRFWRATIAGLALDARPPIAVRLTPNRAAPGQRVNVMARVRRLERERLGDSLTVSARVADQPIRLWPDTAAGSFYGSFIAAPAEGDGSTAILVDVDSVGSRRSQLSIDRHIRESFGPPLALLAASHGGVDVGPEQLRTLEDHLRASTNAPAERTPRYPMRSAWWFAPFAACLSAEWWLRRRSGRR